MQGRSAPDWNPGGWTVAPTYSRLNETMPTMAMEFVLTWRGGVW
jgi:hypothetical protein